MKNALICTAIVGIVIFLDLDVGADGTRHSFSGIFCLCYNAYSDYSFVIGSHSINFRKAQKW